MVHSWATSPFINEPFLWLFLFKICRVPLLPGDDVGSLGFGDNYKNGTNHACWRETLRGNKITQSQRSVLNQAVSISSSADEQPVLLLGLCALQV